MQVKCDGNEVNFYLWLCSVMDKEDREQSTICGLIDRTSYGIDCGKYEYNDCGKYYKIIPNYT